jgi:hypothetical protein
MNMNKTAFLSVFFSLFVLTQVQAQQVALDKYQAIFLYKFTNYMEWPAGASETRIGILGESAVYDLLSNMLASRNANVTIERVSPQDNLASYHMVFLPDNMSENFEAIKASIGNNSVVLVTEQEKLAYEGASIGFYVNGDRLRFSINEAELSSRNIKVSKSLLSLGKKI